MDLIRRSTIISLLLIITVMLSGCVRNQNIIDDNFKKYGATGLKKIGVVLSAPNGGDTAVSEAVTAGVKQAAGVLDANYRILKAKDLVNNVESLRYLAENNYDLVVALGQTMEADLAMVAEEFPDIKFAILDGEVDQPNVISVKLKEDDGAFLAGVEAASLTKNNLVGYMGDSMIMDRAMETGFLRGVQYMNMMEGKQVKVNVTYTGITDKPARLAEMSKNVADNFYWTGSDVVFAGSNRLGNGLTISAAQNRKIAITCELQLLKASPWNVYGAVAGKPDAVIYDLAKKVLGGNFSAGRVGYGLAQGAVDFVPSQAVSADISDKLASIKNQLKKGLLKPFTIQIPQGLVIQPSTIQPGSTKPGTQQKNPGTSAGTSQPGANQPGTSGQGAVTPVPTTPPPVLQGTM